MTLSNESIARYRNDKDGLDKQELYYAIDKLCDSHESLREQVNFYRGNVESVVKKGEPLTTTKTAPLYKVILELIQRRASLRSQPEAVKPYEFKVGDEVELIDGAVGYTDPADVNGLKNRRGKITKIRKNPFEDSIDKDGKFPIVINDGGWFRPQDLRLVKPVEITREEFRIGQSIVWNGKLGYVYWRGYKDDVSKEPLVNFNLAGGGFVCNIPESQIEPKYETD